MHLFRLISTYVFAILTLLLTFVLLPLAMLRPFALPLGMAVCWWLLGVPPALVALFALVAVVVLCGPKVSTSAALLLLLPSVALADGTPSVIAPPPTGSISAVALGLLGPVVGFIVQNWGLALAVALLGGAAWVAKKLLAEAATLTAKAPAGAPRHAALAILEAARVGVGYVEQKVAPTLRGQDGKLSPEAQNAAKAAAIQAALEWLGMQGLDTAKAAWGLTDEQLLKQLGVAIEAEVANGPAKAPSVAPAPIAEATGPADKELRATPSGRPIAAVAGKGG